MRTHRAARVDLATPAEAAIRAAIEAAEHAGCSPVLTEVVVLLSDALDKLSEVVDETWIRSLGEVRLGTFWIAESRGSHTGLAVDGGRPVGFGNERLAVFASEKAAQAHIDKQEDPGRFFPAEHGWLEGPSGEP